MGKVCCKPSQFPDQKFTGDGKNGNGARAANKYRVPPVPKRPSVSTKKRVRALYQFQAVNDGDLPFMKGDLMELDDDSLPDTTDWIRAQHLQTKRMGFIPSNYVTIADSSPQASDWWFPFDKKEANKALLRPGNYEGTFLIRKAGDETSYVLSVRDKDITTGDPCPKHYRLHAMDDDRGYYISPQKTFPTISDIITFYKENVIQTGSKLTKPCQHTPPTVPFRELEIDRDKVRFIKKLGTGCFAEVWKGIYLHVVDVAVKTLKPGTMSSEAFLEEAKIMHKLRHRRLVQILAVVSKEEPFYIITELMVNGALYDILRSATGKLIKFGTLIDFNAQIAEGMAYLEKVQFIHRDLRAANILVGENNEVKVADFGLARMLKDDQPYFSNPNAKYPLKWSSPEAATERKFSVKSDVWSFGILMYEIITFGRVPYPGMSNVDVIQQIESGYRMSKPDNGLFPTPEPYYQMMLKCWSKNPKQRPTFASLHDFFSNYYINIEPAYGESDTV